MSETVDKLQEAKYFLQCMISNESERVLFRYNLSAFLSAARSVTLIMQSEYNNVPGFSKWYEEKQKIMQSDHIMKLLNEMRRNTIHIHSVQPRAVINANLKDSVVISGYLSIAIENPDGTFSARESVPDPNAIPPKLDTTPEIKWKWYFDGLPGKDIVTLSIGHIAKLESLVNECESQFTT